MPMKKTAQFCLDLVQVRVGINVATSFMDQHNNRIGIELTDLPGSCEEKVLKSLHLLRH